MELGAKFRDEPRGLDLRPYADLAQHAIARGQERFADMKSWERALFNDQRAQPMLPCPRRRTAAGGPATNYQYIVLERFRHLPELRLAAIRMSERADSSVRSAKDEIPG